MQITIDESRLAALLSRMFWLELSLTLTAIVAGALALTLAALLA
jgi:hypothetical protein